MRHFQEKQKAISFNILRRSRRCQLRTSCRNQLENHEYTNHYLKEESRRISKHTKRCDLCLRSLGFCHEPASHPTFKYRHQHQQYIRKHLKHIIQQHSSRYTFASQPTSQSSASPSNASTYFFHLISAGWNQKLHKSFTKLQPKSISPLESCSRSNFWKFYHQNKNSTEKTAGKLLRRSSGDRGGSIEKKQFDRKYRSYRNNNYIKWIQQEQQQQQPIKQVKRHIKLLFNNAFIKNTITARKH